MSIDRERTIRWVDPLETAKRYRTMSGLDALRALIAGELPPPPIATLIGWELRSAAPGEVTASLVPHETHYNPLGMMHGGVVATLMDTVMGCAVHSMSPMGRGYTTLNINVQYLRAIKLETGEVFAEAKIVHVGRSTALAEGRVIDAKGRVCATAQTTCLLFDLPPSAS